MKIQLLLAFITFTQFAIAQNDTLLVLGKIESYKSNNIEPVVFKVKQENDSLFCQVNTDGTFQFNIQNRGAYSIQSFMYYNWKIDTIASFFKDSNYLILKIKRDINKMESFYSKRRFDSLGAIEDIKRGTLVLLLPGGVTGVYASKKEDSIARKYGFQYFCQGCQKTSLDDEIAYNKIILKYLYKKHPFISPFIIHNQTIGYNPSFYTRVINRYYAATDANISNDTIQFSRMIQASYSFSPETKQLPNYKYQEVYMEHVFPYYAEDDGCYTNLYVKLKDKYIHIDILGFSFYLPTVKTSIISQEVYLNKTNKLKSALKNKTFTTIKDKYKGFRYFTCLFYHKME